MANLEKRLAKLSGRMNDEAWSRLRKALSHPRFPEILSDLEAVDGTLNIGHVQGSLTHFLDRRRNKR